MKISNPMNTAFTAIALIFSLAGCDGDVQELDGQLVSADGNIVDERVLNDESADEVPGSDNENGTFDDVDFDITEPLPVDKLTPEDLEEIADANGLECNGHDPDTVDIDWNNLVFAADVERLCAARRCRETVIPHHLDDGTLLSQTVYKRCYNSKGEQTSCEFKSCGADLDNCGDWQDCST